VGTGGDIEGEIRPNRRRRKKHTLAPHSQAAEVVEGSAPACAALEYEPPRSARHPRSTAFPFSGQRMSAPYRGIGWHRFTHVVNRVVREVASSLLLCPAAATRW